MCRSIDGSGNAVQLGVIASISDDLLRDGWLRDGWLNRVTLYRILAEGGNPRLASLAALLKAMGLKIKVEQKMAG